MIKDWFCPEDIKAVKAMKEEPLRQLFIHCANQEYCKSFSEGRGCALFQGGKCCHPDYDRYNNELVSNRLREVMKANEGLKFDKNAGGLFK